MIHEDTMSQLMFWVGAMFVFTPLLVVAVVVLSMRHHRRKQADRPQPTP